MREKRKWPRRLILLVWVFVALGPLYWTIITSMKSQIDIFNGPKFIPWVDFEPSFLAWQTLFTEYRDSFLSSLGNSVLFASLSALLSVILGAMGAYGLSRYQYKYGPYRNDDLSLLVVSQRIMPPIVSILALYVIYVQLRMLDTPLGMILAYTSANLPLALFLLRNFFDAIPVEMEHAAALDGYRAWHRLTKIVFPLAAPGLATAFMLSFFFAWNDFLFALVLSFNRAQTLPVFITSLTAQSQPLWWLISAVGLVALIPPVIVTLFLDRFMSKQVLIGGVR